MGLYLCVFDEYGNDLCGVEVGRYQYFAEFRKQVAIFVDEGRFGSKMPTLLQHSDCDGVWTVSQYKELLKDLEEIGQVLKQEPPNREIQNLKGDIFRFFGVVPRNLYECFVDTNCEFLIERLTQLCDRAIKENQPIVFQ